MAIKPIDPVPVLTKNGLVIHTWQRWFLDLQQTVNKIITSNASVGNFTEVTGSLIALTSATVTPLCALSLTAGDWDIQGTVEFEPAATTQYSDLILGVSQSATAFGVSPGSRTRVRAMTNTIGVSQLNPELSTPSVRVSLAAAATVYLLTEVTFAVAGMSAIGYMRARSF